MASLRLGDYVETVYYNGLKATEQSNRPFNNGNSQTPPMLRRHGMNRILLFPGSFNPPHQGHLQLLRHVFENAGDDLCIVASILIMSNDDRLREKLSDKENPIIFPKQQRVSLWRGAIATLDWAWVYDRSESSWMAFRAELVRKLKYSSIELKFILLGGPDTINAKERIDPRYWECPDMITSDISRPVDFRYPNSLRQLSGCSMWEKPKFDRSKFERQIRTRLQKLPDSTIDQAVSEAFEKLNTNWVCYRLRKPKGMIRFIPGDFDSRPRDPPSSTSIRKHIMSSSATDGTTRLATLALSPGLLIEYVGQGLTIMEQSPNKHLEPGQKEENKWEEDFW